MESIRDLFNRLFRKNKNIWKIDLLIIVVFLVFILIVTVWQPNVPGREEIDQTLEKYGSLGPLAIIGVIILEVIIAPIPGGFIPIVAGALYGVWLGSLYTWTGNVVGSTIAFWLARKLGRPIIKKIVAEKKIIYFDYFLQRNRFLVWLVYIIPAFPIDIISFALGFSDMKFKRFFKIITIGFAAHVLLLTFLGERILLATGMERIWYLLGVMVIVVVGFTAERIIYKEVR